MQQILAHLTSAYMDDRAPAPPQTDSLPANARGGTSGLVGPLEIGLDAVTAAGSITRKDVQENALGVISKGCQNVSLREACGGCRPESVEGRSWMLGLAGFWRAIP